MKKLLLLIAVAAMAIAGCTGGDETTWEKYSDWRESNNSWLAASQAKTNEDGTPYYTTIVPQWLPSTFVLVHYFNDRAETEGNLSPLYNSTIDVRYHLSLYDGTAVDSSTTLTANGPGIYRAQLTGLISGWAIAMSDMRCGDTAEVIIPYAAAYGETGTGSVPPYSNLKFNISLVDIPYYELAPYE